MPVILSISGTEVASFKVSIAGEVAELIEGCETPTSLPDLLELLSLEAEFAGVETPVPMELQKGIRSVKFVYKKADVEKVGRAIKALDKLYN